MRRSFAAWRDQSARATPRLWHLQRRQLSSGGATLVTPGRCCHRSSTCTKSRRSPTEACKPCPRQSALPASRQVPPQPDLGPLPEWNLADLYPAIDAPEVKRDLERADAECLAFEEAYKGKLAELAAAPMAGRRSPRR